MFDGYYALAYLIAFVATALSVFLHYEMLATLSRYLDRFLGRIKVLVMLFCVMVLHIIEIAIFAVVYWLMSLEPSFGEIVDIQTNADYVYYSSIVYTTVGFGDLYPIGPVRIVTALESLIGLVLITWSATYIFVQHPNSEKA